MSRERPVSEQTEGPHVGGGRDLPIARILDEDEGYLFFLAGKIPDDLRRSAVDRTRIVESFANFRKTVAR